MPKLGEVRATDIDLHHLQLTTSNREPSTLDPPGNPRLRTACPPIPDSAYALPAHPPLLFLPKRQRLQDRQRRPHIRLERGIPYPRWEEKAGLWQQVWC